MSVVCKCKQKCDWKDCLLHAYKCSCNISLIDFYNWIIKKYPNCCWITTANLTVVYKKIPTDILSLLSFNDVRLMTILPYEYTKKIYEPLTQTSIRIEPIKSFCMISDSCCSCTGCPCYYRLVANNLLKRKPYHGLPVSLVLREYQDYPRRHSTPVTNARPTLSFQFFEKVINLLPVKPSSKKQYIYTIKKAFDNNAPLDNPMSLTVETIRTFKNVFYYLSDSQLFILFGQNYLHILFMYQRAISIANGNLDVQKMSTKEEESWCSLEELKSAIHKMEVDYKTIYEYQRIVWFKMELEIPLRNEWSTLKVQSYNVNTDNYIILQDSSFKLVLNDYKTVKTHSQYTTYIQPDTGDLYNNLLQLYNYRLEHNKDYLFLSLSDEPFKQDQFSKFITSITKKYLDKSIGSRMIRKIVVSKELENDVPLHTKQELANKMLHTVNTQATYRRLT